jgi:hypothetical protein
VSPFRRSPQSPLPCKPPKRALVAGAIHSLGHPISEELEKSNDQRAKSVARLVTELGANIRLVHGTAAGLVGNVGSQSRFHWGPLLPGFARYVNALTALEFGQSAEIRST